MRKRRVLSIVMALLFLISTVYNPMLVNVRAEEELTEGNYKYTINEDGVSVTITGTVDAPQGDITIPGELDGKTVTVLGKSAFARNNAITSVSIPDTVRTIGEGAFSDCSNLASVKFPEELVTLNERAFHKTGITGTLTLPGKVTTVGVSAFETTKITKLVLPDSLTTLSLSSFAFNTSLSEITWPDNENFKVVQGFQGCTSLDDSLIENLPASVTTIGEYAFQNDKFVDITIPANIIEISKHAFQDCKNLVNVRFATGSKLATISGFYGCEQLSDKILVNMPSSVKSIGVQAFTYCHFKNISIPSNVENLRENAFDSNLYVDELDIHEGVKSIGDGVFNSLGTKGELSEIVIPKSVAYIGDGAFSKINGDRTVDIIIKNSDVLTEEETGKPYQNPLYSGKYYKSNMFQDSDVNVYAPSVNSKGEESLIKMLCEIHLQDPSEPQYPRFVGVKFYNLNIESEKELNINGKVPATSKVTLVRNGSSVNLPVDNEAKFVCKVFAGTSVVIKVSLEGYYDYVVAKAAREMVADWDIGEISEADFVKLPEESLSDDQAEENYGWIEVSATSDYAGYEDVLVFNSDGSLADELKVMGSSTTTVGLVPGEYTVVAFNDNDYFASVPNIESLTQLGLKADVDYAKTSAQVTETKTTKVSLEVPLLDVSRFNELVNADDSQIIVESEQMTGNKFLTEVSYSLKTATDNEIRVHIPSGMYVSKAYIKEKDVTKEVAFDSLTEGEFKTSVTALTGSIYLYLVADQADLYDVYAYVDHKDAASGVTISIPIDSALISVYDIKLQSVGTVATGKDNVAYVYGKPNVDVKFSIDGSNTMISAKTNQLGKATINYALPGKLYDGKQYKLNVRSATASASTSITYYEKYTRLDNLTVTQGDNAFSVVKDGKQSKFNYTYISNGDAKYTNWAFNAKVKSKYKMADKATLFITMMDGSEVAYSLDKIKSETVDGETVNTYCGQATFGKVGMHAFTPDTVPAEFGVFVETLDFADAHSSELSETGAQEYQDSMSRVRAEISSNISDANTSLLSTYNQLIEKVYSDNKSGFTGGLDEFKLSDNDIDFNEYLLNASHKFNEKSYLDRIPEKIKTDVFMLETSMDEYFLELADAVCVKGTFSDYQSWDEVEASAGKYYAPDVKYDETKDYAKEGYKVDSEGKYAYKLVDEIDEKTSVTADVASSDEKILYYKIITTEGTYYMTEAALMGGTTGETKAKAKISNALDMLKADIETADLNAYQAKAVVALLADVETAEYVVEDTYARIFSDIDVETSVEEPLTKASLTQKSLPAVSAMSMYEDYPAGLVRARKEFQQYLAEANEIFKIYEDWVRKYGENVYCVQAVKNYATSLRYLATFFGSLPSEYYFRFRERGINNLTGELSRNSSWFSKIGFGVSNGYAAQFAELYNDMLKWGAEYHSADCYNFRRTKHYSDIEIRRAMVRLGLKPILDPSGIVYEAVPSNTLEGVEATVYYSASEDGTDAVVWDAENYDQINPQITDLNGAYEWYVPDGYYQVRFTKDGYEDTATEWLPVPPVQMNLKTAMVSTANPKVEYVYAYKDYADVTFSQYMDTSAKLTTSGKSYEWLNEEEGYAKTVRIWYNSSATVGANVNISLFGAKSYAAKEIDAYSQDAVVMNQITKIELNYTKQITLDMNEENVAVTAKVLDESGNAVENAAVKAVIGSSSLGAIASTDGNSVVQTDKNGIAKFMLKTSEFIGETDITFSVLGTDCKTSIPLLIAADKQKPARVVAKLGTTVIDASYPKDNKVTVSAGTKLELGCATEGAVIYYTTDDTCPCQNTSGRIKYTGPITLDKSMYIRIAAYVEGRDYSDRLNITITVLDANSTKPDANVTESDVIHTESNVAIAKAEPVISKLVNEKSDIKVTWKKIDSASGYKLYRKAGKKDWVLVYTGGGLSYADKSVKNGEKYNYKVVAYSNNSKELSNSKESKIKTIYRLSNVKTKSKKVKKVEKKLYTIKLKLKKNKKATGYELQYKKGKKLTTLKTKKLSITLKKCKTKKVKVRAYKKVGKTYYYSAWS